MFGKPHGIPNILSVLHAPDIEFGHVAQVLAFSVDYGIFSIEYYEGFSATKIIQPIIFQRDDNLSQPLPRRLIKFK